MRQIGVAIGSSNANVIGYHFGTRDALVEAILLRNRPQVEARRAELLEQARHEGRDADLPTLLEALCRPVFERTNSDGLHTYALFLRHISRSKWWARNTYASSIPSTRETVESGRVSPLSGERPMASTGMDSSKTWTTRPSM